MNRLYVILAATLTIVGVVACSKEEPAVEHTGYKVGDYYKKGLVEGIVCYTFDKEGESGVLLSLNEWSVAWSTSNDTMVGVANPSDGLYNWAVVTSLPGWEQRFPAFAVCNSLNSAMVIGWHLPSMGDFGYVRSLLNIEGGLERVNELLVEYGGDAITSSSFWSSTEMGPAVAYFIDLKTGGTNYANKQRQLAVRAIKYF